MAFLDYWSCPPESRPFYCSVDLQERWKAGRPWLKKKKKMKKIYTSSWPLKETYITLLLWACEGSLMSARNSLTIGPILTLLSPSLPFCSVRCSDSSIDEEISASKHPHVPKKAVPFSQSRRETPGVSTNNKPSSTWLHMAAGQPGKAPTSLLITPSGASKRFRCPGKRVPGKSMRGNS